MSFLPFALNCKLTWGKRFIVVACSLLLSNILGYAQGLNVALYQSKQGLSVNLTKAIAQDNYNFVWIGTDEGLIKFDGNRFHHYRKALSSNYVKSLYHTRNGRLLVVHDMGVAEILSTPDTVIFTTLLAGAPVKTDTTAHYPKSIFEDATGNLWIGESQSLMRLSPDGRKKRYEFPAKCVTESFLRTFSFAEDGFGSFFVISQTGYLFTYRANGDAFEELPLPQRLTAASAIMNVNKGKVWIASSDAVTEVNISADGKLASVGTVADLTGVSSLHVGTDGTIYAGTWARGLYKFKASTRGITAQKVREFPLSNVNMIAGNQSGELWFSSDEGIALAKPTFFAPALIEGSRNFIQAIIKDASGTLYTTDGDKVFKLTEQNNTFIGTSLFEAKGVNILCMTIAAGKLWLGTSGGLVYGIDKNGIDKSGTAKSVRFGAGMCYYMHPNADGSFWLCAGAEDGITKISASGDVRVYGHDKGVFSSIRVIKPDKSGTLYCAGRGTKSYLFRYNSDTDTFTDISKPLPIKAAEDFEVADISVQGEHILLATNYGLFEYTPSGGTVKLPLIHPYTGEEILILKSLTKDGEGTLWIGTSEGMIKYSASESILFDEESGLPANSISLRACLWDETVGLWIGTTKGLAYSRAQYKNRQSHRPLLTGFQVNGQSLILSSLKQGDVYSFESNIQVEVTAVVYPGNNVRYQYRAVGAADSSWSIPQREPELTLLKLPYGAYRLEIRALQQGGYLWSGPLYQSFVISKAWYSHWWVWVLIVGGGAALVWGILLLNSRRLQQQNERLEKVIGERTESVEQEKIRAEQALIEAQAAKELAEEAQKTIEQEKQYLSNSVEMMLGAIERLADGDLTVQLSVTTNDDIGRLASGINTMSANVREMIEQVTEAAYHVADSVKKISSSSLVMTKAAERQSTKAAEVTLAMEHTSEMIQNNASQASTNADVASQGERAAAEGEEIIRQTVEKIRRIAVVMNESSATVQKLGEASAQIGEIAEVIQEIADQTNLLALNAAIEAARAGDQGRGFAVVADEVRKLAERTAKATKEIAYTIRAVQTETRNAVTMMNMGGTEMEEGIKLADKTGGVLQVIVQGIKKNVTMLEMLAEASEVEMKTAVQISDGIRDIHHSIRDAEQGIENITSAVSDLDVLTENLQEQIARFQY